MAGSLLQKLSNALTRKKKLDLDLAADTDLERCLTAFDLSLIGIGSTLGAGIYVLTGDVARYKAGPAIVLSFLLAAVASLLSGLCYAEFGSRIPKAGSAYVYCYLTIGEFIAFIIGWNILLEYLIGASAIARGLSAYVDSLTQHQLRQAVLSITGEIHLPGVSKYLDIYAFIFVIIFTTLLSLGIKNASRLNNFFVLVNVATICTVIGVGVFYGDVKNWKDFAPFGAEGIISGASTCFFAFIGFDVIATASEETKNPARSIPLSIGATITVCFLAYFGVSGVITLMVPYAELNAESAVASAFMQRNLTAMSYIIGAGAVMGLLGCTLTSMIPLPRLLYAMAQDGLIPAIFGRVNEVTKVPVFSSIMSGIFIGVMALVLDLSALVEMLSIGTLLAYSIVIVSVMVLRYSKDQLGSPSKSYGTGTPECIDDTVGNDDSKSPPSFFKKDHNQCVINMVIVVLLLELGAICMFLSCVSGKQLGSSWKLVLVLIVLLLALLATLIFLALQKQNTSMLQFKTPLVPWLPTIALFFNIYLALQLNWLTWVRLAVWMALGLVLYFCYGMHHSAERESQSGVKEQSEEAVSKDELQHLCEDGQDDEELSIGLKNEEKQSLLRSKQD